MDIIVIHALLVISTLLYVAYFGPKLRKKRELLSFDSRVLSVIDGLYLSGMKFGCTDFEMREFAYRLLQKAHSLPDTESLLEHTISLSGSGYNGFVYRSHIGLHGDHIIFALLCILEYAKRNDDKELISQCEHLLPTARHQGFHYEDLMRNQY